MKLDPTVMRSMERQDFRVLEAVEKGMQNHALVPVPLIASLASLRHGGATKIISSLLRDKLLSHDQSCGYDGYRITNSGYDILALFHLKQRKHICALGDRIGTGKESDVYLGATPSGHQVVLKFHRLGRTSFRDVKKKRDYFHMEMTKSQLQRGSSASLKQMPHSWLFLSRLSAIKEYAFLKALYDVHFPTPKPLAHNRHIVVMSLVRGMPLYQIPVSQLSADQAQSIMEQSTELATRLAQHGLVHCDLNEFNLMVDVSGVQHKQHVHTSTTRTTTTGGANHHTTSHHSVAGGSTIQSHHRHHHRHRRHDVHDDLDSVADHYVRHSGLPVSHDGALSVPTTYAAASQQRYDGTGELITEAPPEPSEYLDNGQAKPIVILIDFPQMVSTRHPNAQELFERDVRCLKRFFTNKVQCVPEDWDLVLPKWQDVVPIQTTTTTTSASAADDDKNHNDGENDRKEDDTVTVCLASKAQIRLDEELRASGYSVHDAQRGSELYYYESAAHRSAREDLFANQNDNDEDDDEEEEEEEEEVVVEDDKEPNGEIIANPDTNHDVLGEPNADLSEDDGDSDALEEEAGVVVLDLLDDDQLSLMTRQVAEIAAKTRVRQEVDERRRKDRQRGAFRKRNSNKSYIKGKRVLADAGC